MHITVSLYQMHVYYDIKKNMDFFLFANYEITRAYICYNNINASINGLAHGWRGSPCTLKSEASSRA